MPCFYRRGEQKESSWRNIYPLFALSHPSLKSHSWLCRSPGRHEQRSPRTEWSSVLVSSQTAVPPTLLHCLCFLSSLLFCCCSNVPKEGFPNCATQNYLMESLVEKLSSSCAWSWGCRNQEQITPRSDPKVLGEG